MQNINTTNQLTVKLPERFGERYFQLPTVLRLLLDNVMRHSTGSEQQAYTAAIFAWLETGTSTAEIPFRPGRVLMHDTTSTPALVDIAAMRDAIAQVGLDPQLLNPQLPVDVSVDHSLAVERYAVPDAAHDNLNIEMRRNRERYQFLRWASKALTNVTIHPPGTGIMHTLHLEQLAKVVIEQDGEQKDGELMPDTMLGTDSHTPMVNGIGILGWGVGGLEAQTVMFGLPTMLRLPDVIGVELIGKLGSGVQATDLALVVTKALRTLNGKGLSGGEFVEYFGAGVSTLSAGARCVIANMAPEYGATTGYFAVDERTLDYLRSTGRDEAHLERIKRFTQSAGLWFDPASKPRYTEVLTIDLSTVGMHVAGPTRPQDLLDYGDTGAALKKLNLQTQHPVAIAAITSCTNTTDPRLLIAAGLVARKAHALGLTCPPWVKTSLAPGSPAAASYLKRSGLLEDLEALGFGIVGFGCTTCIGNTGSLTPEIVKRQTIDRQSKRGEQSEKAVAILSGNRNFPGRVHPDLELAFIMSPALVVAFGLAGNAACNLRTEPVQMAPSGQAVYLRDIWPSDEEIDAHLALGQSKLDYRHDFQQASRNPLWLALPSQSGPQFKWDAASTALRSPPFAKLSEGSLLGHYRAYPLLVLGDDVTTDHISPASAIPPDSLVADFLVKQGDSREDLNVFASRRGNWEVMLRAAFHSKTLKNTLAQDASVAHTLHQPSGSILPIWEVAASYATTGQATVIVAGERYGMGSSRDWAAKGQRLLGVRAVLASSFERIHRSNLIGMGILPLVLPATAHPNQLKLQAGDQIEVKATARELAPRGNIIVIIHRQNASTELIAATAGIETQFEIDLLHAGGVIPYILKKTIRENTSA